MFAPLHALAFSLQHRGARLLSVDAAVLARLSEQMTLFGAGQHRMEKSIETLTTNVSTLTTNVSTLTSAVSNLASDVSNLASDVSNLKLDAVALQTTVSALSSGQNRLEKTLSRIDRTVDQLVQRNVSGVVRSMDGSAAATPAVLWGLGAVARYLDYKDSSALLPLIRDHAAFALSGSFAMFEARVAEIASKAAIARVRPCAPKLAAFFAAPSLKSAAAAGPHIVAHCQATMRKLHDDVAGAHPSGIAHSAKIAAALRALDVQTAGFVELNAAIMSLAVSSNTFLPQSTYDRIEGTGGAGLLVVTHLVNMHINTAGAEANPARCFGSSVLQVDGSGRRSTYHAESGGTTGAAPTSSIKEVVLRAVKIERGPNMSNAHLHLTRNLLVLALCDHALGHHQRKNPINTSAAKQLSMAQVLPGEGLAPMRYRLEGAIHLLVAPPSGSKTISSRTIPLPMASSGGPVAHPSCICDLVFRVSASSQISSWDREDDDNDDCEGSEDVFF